MVAHGLHLAAAKAFLFTMIDYGSELFRLCDVWLPVHIIVTGLNGAFPNTHLVSVRETFS